MITKSPIAPPILHTQTTVDELNSEIQNLRAQLEEAREEVEAAETGNRTQREIINEQDAFISRLESEAEALQDQLSRYEQAVSVTGDYLDEPDNGHMWWIALDDRLPFENGQHIRVLVMKEEG